MQHAKKITAICFRGKSTATACTYPHRGVARLAFTARVERDLVHLVYLVGGIDSGTSETGGKGETCGRG